MGRMIAIIGGHRLSASLLALLLFRWVWSVRALPLRSVWSGVRREMQLSLLVWRLGPLIRSRRKRSRIDSRKRALFMAACKGPGKPMEVPANDLLVESKAQRAARSLADMAFRWQNAQSGE